MKAIAQSVAVLSLFIALAACGDKTANSASSGTEVKPTATAADAKPAAQAPMQAQPTQTAAAKPEQAAPAGDHPGKALHDANCISCHGVETYTRPDRKITSLEALAARVRACDANLGTQLFDEDIDKITAYLNETYYKFPAK